MSEAAVESAPPAKLSHHERQRRVIDARARRIIAPLNELAADRVSVGMRQRIEVAAITGASHQWLLAGVRKSIWLTLRLHPDAKLSTVVIGRFYNRDHTTVCTQTNDLRARLAAGHEPHSLDTLQWYCDQLAERGFKPFYIRGAL